ncbi:MAG: hypothetical protein ACLP8S_29455 [Solirubrobacteraceae bacterium]
MRKSKIILTAGALASAAAIAITGAASATATAKNERFTLITTSTTSPDPALSVIATGAVTDGGTAKKTKTGLMMTFPDGTITLDTKKLPKNPDVIQTASACLETQTVSGTFTVAGGTGVYKGITGSGRISKSSTFVEQLVHGNCASNYSAVQVVATASGTVSLP